MSALPPKADMCSAPAHVRFVPIADIRELICANRKTAARRSLRKSDQVVLITQRALLLSFSCAPNEPQCAEAGGEEWKRDALYLVVLITFVEEGHPCAGNYRNQN